MGNDITYTFPQDCPIPQLRGLTVTGGKFCRIDGAWQKEPDAVRFAERIEGKAVVARIAGKPELEAALTAHNNAKIAVAKRLATIGWPTYQAIQAKCINARAAYDAAAEYGYPVREAAAAKAAESALEQARIDYPGAAAYALAESYNQACNDVQAKAGRMAMREIEQGADPEIAIHAMQWRWQDAAEALVERS